jgi:hypothetical protein
MNRNDYLITLLLGAVYILLAGFLTGMTVTWGDFVSSDDFWSQSNATAIAYMQIYHSIGVGIAALFAGLVIAWRFGRNWVRPTTIVAVIGGSYVLFDQIRGVWFLSQHDLTPKVFHVVSGGIDVLKVTVILFVVTAVLTRLVAPRRAARPK